MLNLFIALIAFIALVWLACHYLKIKNSNNNKPLLETRLQFINKEQFIASYYFYNKLGLVREVITQPNIATSPNNALLPEIDILPMIGDNFAQNQLIVAQLQNLTGNLNNNKYGNDNYQQIITKLVENAKIEADIVRTGC